MSEKRTGCLGWMVRLFLLVMAIGVVNVIVNPKAREAVESNRQTQQKDDRTLDEMLADQEQFIKENNKGRPLIPGLLPVDVHGNLTDKGFELTTNLGGIQCEWLCRRVLPYGDMTCDAFGPNPNGLWAVSATVTAAEGFDDEQRNDADEFLPFIATLPYDGATPDKAAKWVRENIGAHGLKKAFGPVQFELLRGTGYGLRLSAVEPNEPSADGAN